MLTVLPQIEALYEVHIPIDRHETLVAVLAIVAGQFLKGERTVGGAADTDIAAAAFCRFLLLRRSQLSVKGSTDHGEAKDRTYERGYDDVLRHPDQG